jgi:hypothetical protein
VKEEDVDWLVYHIIAREQAISFDDLKTACGFSAPELEASVIRLERALLVGRSEGEVRVLSFGESLILCQVKYSDDLPFIIKDGMIREKKQ